MYSDIRSTYVELDDHMTPPQSDKNRRLLNIKKHKKALGVFFPLIPSEIFGHQFNKTGSTSLFLFIRLCLPYYHAK